MEPHGEVGASADGLVTLGAGEQRRTMHVELVSLVVHDYDEAIAFFVGRLD